MSTTTFVSNDALHHVQKSDKRLFEKLQKGFSGRIPVSASLEQSCKEFLVDVKCYALMLENRLAPAPQHDDLKKKEQIVLNQYWDFIDACKRIESAAFKDKCLASFVSPVRYELQINNPTVDIELTTQLKVLADHCKNYTKTLMESGANSQTQTDRILGLLQGDIAKNVSRFSQIVDKGGGPIGTLAWKTTGAYFKYATVKQPEPRVRDSHPNGTFPRLCTGIDLNRLTLVGIPVPQIPASNIPKDDTKNPMAPIVLSLETSRTEPGSKTPNITENASPVSPATSTSQENSNTQTENKNV
jgi:hypothetical protein